ncbi:Uncharacterised protein [Mycobacteroides abscessus subsp. abscessus]|nr:Uncharacterised protein [Mycobacteroides abscessus subsp. abscessus]
MTDDRTGTKTRVNPHAGKRRDIQGAQGAGTGPVVIGRILGAQTGLDRVTANSRVVHLLRQRAAHGYEQLGTHQVEAGDQLGNRVLDLQPGVHLEEGEGVGFAILSGVVDELDRPGAYVADGARGGDGGLAHPSAQRVVDDR